MLLKSHLVICTLGQKFRAVFLSTQEITKPDGSTPQKSICDQYAFNTFIIRAQSSIVCAGNPLIVALLKNLLLRSYIALMLEGVHQKMFGLHHKVMGLVNHAQLYRHTSTNFMLRCLGICRMCKLLHAIKNDSLQASISVQQGLSECKGNVGKAWWWWSWYKEAIQNLSLKLLKMLQWTLLK